MQCTAVLCVLMCAALCWSATHALQLLLPTRGPLWPGRWLFQPVAAHTSALTLLLPRLRSPPLLPQRLLRENYGIEDMAMVACDPWSGARLGGWVAGLRGGASMCLQEGFFSSLGPSIN